MVNSKANTLMTQQVAEERYVALFRKKLPVDLLWGMAVNIFESRLNNIYEYVATSVSEISDGETDAEFQDKDRGEKLNLLWFFAATKLSRMKQNDEASALSIAITEFFSSDAELLNIRSEAERIVQSQNNDDLLFHNVTYNLFITAFPKCSKYVSAYGNEQAGTCVISGVELASCLRGIDFLLKDHKLA
jgi:hypothetical protein